MCPRGGAEILLRPSIGGVCKPLIESCFLVVFRFAKLALIGTRDDPTRNALIYAIYRICPKIRQSPENLIFRRGAPLWAPLGPYDVRRLWHNGRPQGPPLRKPIPFNFDEARS